LRTGWSKCSTQDIYGGKKRKRKQSVFRSNMVKFVHGAVLVEVKASYMERNLGEL